MYHDKAGLIITGGNSKRQPELATFWEKAGDALFHLPMSSSLTWDSEREQLALAYSTFFSVTGLSFQKGGVDLRTEITRKSRTLDAQMNLQLVLHEGETIETGAGRRVVVGHDPIDFGPEAIGGEVRHHGWTMEIGQTARLQWPFCPFNPYANGPETSLEHAVGLLSVPVREAGTILFRLSALQ